jgi:hypothetical protein
LSRSEWRANILDPCFNDWQAELQYLVFEDKQELCLALLKVLVSTKWIFEEFRDTIREAMSRSLRKVCIFINSNFKKNLLTIPSQRELAQKVDKVSYKPRDRLCEHYCEECEEEKEEAEGAEGYERLLDDENNDRWALMPGRKASLRTMTELITGNSEGQFSTESDSESDSDPEYNGNDDNDDDDTNSREIVG